MGRRAVEIVSAVLIGLQALVLVLAWRHGAATATLALQLIVVVALATALFLGHGWARVWLGASSAVEALAGARLAWLAASAAQSEAFIVFALIAGACGVTGGLLLFSERVKLFVAATPRGPRA